MGFQDVFAEQHAVLVFDEPFAREAWLAAEIVQHGADFGVHIRQPVHQLPNSARLPPSQSRCALMKMVCGCRANRLCCSSISVSQLG